MNILSIDQLENVTGGTASETKELMSMLSENFGA